VIVVSILNSSSTKVAQVDESECDVKTGRIINANYSIDMVYPIPLTLEQGEDKADYLKAWNASLQILDTDDSTYQKTFIITKTENGKDTNGSPTLLIHGEHKAILEMNREIINGRIVLSNETVTSALTKIMAYSTNWGHGAVTVSKNISIVVGWETVLSALQKVLNACNGEYDIDETNSEIDIADELGANNNVNIRPDLNLKSIVNTQFSRNVINKMYGVGGGQIPATIASARHIVNGYVGGTGVLTVDDNLVVPESDSWNTNYEVYFVTGAEAGNAFTITDCAAGTANDTLTIDTAQTIVAGDKFIIRTTAHADVDFIRAGTSITTYGESQGVYKNERFLDTINLVTTPQLDGTYTGGLCADWTKVSLPTLTENTTATYIQYGTSSQKVVGVDDGDGISQAVTTEADKYYRVLLWVYITGGTVAVTITNDTDSFATSKTFTGWQRFSSYVKSDGTTLTITVLQSGAPVATFYVDAVQVTEGAQQRSFTQNCDQKNLWDAAYYKLIDAKDPELEYKARFIDLYRIDSKKYPYNEISLGDTVTITDDDLEISEVTARVKEITTDEFKPELTEHIVSNI